jgi:hypothetical protein
MALAHINLAPVLGLQVQGDLGPVTMYTQFKAGRRSIVAFAKIWLSDPTTLKQLNHRNRIRAAAADWQLLNNEERRIWQLAARNLGLRTNGYSTWVWWHMLRDRSSLNTIMRQSGIQLPLGNTA